MKFNDHGVQKDKEKKLPLGVSPNIAFSLPHLYGGENCLQLVDCEFVKKLIKDIGGEELVWFVTAEYSFRAEEVFKVLGYRNLSFLNIWEIFTLSPFWDPSHGRKVDIKNSLER